jgi:hypothetical protein
MAGMDANTLFSQALGLGAQWNVVKSEMEVPQRQLRLALDFPAGTKFACPRCGQLCAVHDTSEKEWRHLDFWQHRTDLRARVPREVVPAVLDAAALASTRDSLDGDCLVFGCAGLAGLAECALPWNGKGAFTALFGEIHPCSGRPRFSNLTLSVLRRTS